VNREEALHIARGSILGTPWLLREEAAELVERLPWPIYHANLNADRSCWFIPLAFDLSKGGYIGASRAVAVWLDTGETTQLAWGE